MVCVIHQLDSLAAQQVLNVACGLFFTSPRFIFFFCSTLNASMSTGLCCNWCECMALLCDSRDRSGMLHLRWKRICIWIAATLIALSISHPIQNNEESRCYKRKVVLSICCFDSGDAQRWVEAFYGFERNTEAWNEMGYCVAWIFIVFYLKMIDDNGRDSAELHKGIGWRKLWLE